jgi:two-component system, cell cycle sensor histidine kinase and response regulator CckA
VPLYSWVRMEGGAECATDSVLGKPRSEGTGFGVPSQVDSDQSRYMSAISEITWAWEPSKPEFDSFFDRAPVGLAQCRLSGQVTALNPALERMLGAPLDRARPLTLVDLIEAEDGKEAERQLMNLVQGKCQTVQIDSKLNDASHRSVHWTLWRNPGKNGHLASVLALAQEFGRSPELEQHLQRTARLECVGKLAGGVAHDFNNVLTGILLYCDLLRASLETSHRAHQYADEIRKAALQASNLVKQLLAITRPQSFHGRLLSLNEVAEGMRDLLLRLLGKNIQLQFRLDPNLGLIRLDATQAQQILLNLVLNARDALGQGGHIAVETRNCKLQALSESVLGKSSEASLPCALFVVQDDGCGMDEATRTHMFEPFFTTKGAKGTGLGLATVHEIVTSNGGLIHVASEPAHGTRVSVLLPLVAGIEPEAARPNDFRPQTKGDVLSYQEEE